MKRRSDKLIFIYMALYFMINLLFLGRFPFMHSDESWLAGLTCAMMDEGPAATEPFFDLMPRHPHAIKLLFHLLQMPFIALGGYALIPVRLLSLLAGTAALYFMYRLSITLTGSTGRALLMTALLSVDVQFVYAAHFARQEILLVAVMLAALDFLYRNANGWRAAHDRMLGLLMGLSAGIHPNALLVALAVGGACVYLWAVERKLGPRNLLRLGAVSAACAALFVGASFLMDPDFIRHYFAYGSELGVSGSLGDKLTGLLPYYRKLFHGISVTYYTPPIRIALIAFGIAAAASLVVSVFRRQALRFLVPALTLHAGIMLIGRYSQPAVVFVFPLGYLLILDILSQPVRDRSRAAPAASLAVWALPAILCGTMLVNTALAVRPYLGDEYDRYEAAISQAVPDGARAMANLNAAFALGAENMLDYRNLSYLDAAGESFMEYISRNGIQYIVYPGEMDFIYENRPVWNIVYGNVYPYYQSMREFLSERCELVTQFESPYAMRIIRYARENDWSVRVYRVREVLP
ncbi:MAG: ArnT family glycosyltransferase [Christensenellales bacterium]|jgi:4-amino-4-deoxy-L-arabinose transferase-like glycosyltransferase